MKKTNSNLPILLLFFTGIFLFFIFCIFTTEFNCADRIWNFQNIYKMHQGALIYTNNNVIITPLFFFLGNLLFHLFGANLFVYDVYGIIIYMAKFTLLFAIFKKLKQKTFLSTLYTSIWLILDSSYLANSANYNQLALVFSLIGIFCYLSSYPKKSYHLIQGFLLFLIFFTKQTTGIYYAFGILLFELICPESRQNFFQSQLLKLASFLPCTLFTCIILYWQGNFTDFINLCFGSILEFGTSNQIFSWSDIKYIFLLSFIIGFSTFVIKSENVSNSIKIHTKFLLCLSLGMTFNMYPLLNGYHINMAMFFYYITFIYIIDQLLISEIFTAKQHTTISLIISFGILLALFIRVGFAYFTNYIHLQHFDKNHPFYNTAIASENKEKINIITHYIKAKNATGTQVIVLSYEAASYMIPLNLNNNELDLATCGNLGYHGIQNIIQKISNMKHTEFLIFTEEDDCFYQESKEIRNYILTHLKKTDELLNYSIYINE